MDTYEGAAANLMVREEQTREFACAVGVLAFGDERIGRRR